MHIHPNRLMIVTARVLVTFGFLLCPVLAAADRPPRVVDRVESRNGQFFVRLGSTNDRTTVYRKRAGTKDEKLWEMPAHRGVAFIRPQHAHQKPQQRALADAVGSDQSDVLTGGDPERDIGEQELAARVGVGEAGGRNMSHAEHARTRAWSVQDLVKSARYARVRSLMHV